MNLEKTTSQIQNWKTEHTLTTPAKLKPSHNSNIQPTNHWTNMAENIEDFIISIERPLKSRTKSLKNIIKKDQTKTM